MTRELIKAIFILPGTVLFFVPALVLFVTSGTRFSAQFQYPAEFIFLVGLVPLILGGGLAIATSALFTGRGEGTPAPWAPPQKLVIAGPYRYVRNPMITGAILILLGETILFNSWPLFIWTALFTVGKMIYLPAVEEKELERRFGRAYSAYKNAVPRWLPQLKQWDEGPLN